MILLLFSAMLFFALTHYFLTGSVAYRPLALSIPAVTLLNLNILGKMGFGALGGFDTVAVFAGECRGQDAAAVIRRSVWIATPIIAAAFVLGTACVLVFVKPGDIDLISPITQVLNRGLQSLRFLRLCNLAHRRSDHPHAHWTEAAALQLHSSSAHGRRLGSSPSRLGYSAAS
jgi:hypothetical protein